MGSLVLVDSNVWLDYLLDRRDNVQASLDMSLPSNEHIRPLGELAHAVFESAIGCKFSIMITDHIVEETKRNAPNGTLEQVLRYVRDSGN